MDDTASYQQLETPRLCAQGCGFFCSPATHNLCSKCYRDYMKEIANSSVTAMFVRCDQDPSVLNPSANPWPCCDGASVADMTGGTENRKNRCICCNKKVGILGFACRCGGTFCGVHRYPEKHECKIDFKRVGRAAIAEKNPLVKADKLENRI